MNFLTHLLGGTDAPVKEVTKPVKEEDYSAIIQEIHNKVDWLAELFNQPLAEIDQVKQKINDLEATPIVNHIVRKQKIGFGITEKEKEESDRIEALIKEQNWELINLEIRSQELARLQEIRDKYPLRKFVLRSDVEKLCEKYQLALGYTIHYKGELPEKNMREIENYKPTEDDLKIFKVTEGSWSSFKESFVIESGNELEKRIKPKKYKTGSDMLNDIYYAQIRGVSYVSPYTTEKEEVKSFIIACPAQDLTQTINEVKVTHIPDPIVFAPTGAEFIFQIVSKWGLEANDPLVVNPIEN
jgi:hypothetical protein